MDRIDIHMQVPRVEFQKLRDMRPGETSAEVRLRVEAARQHQRNHFDGTDIASNADMRPAQIRKYCTLNDDCQVLMKTAMRQLQLMSQAYHRVLKIGQTNEWSIVTLASAVSDIPGGSWFQGNGQVMHNKPVLSQSNVSIPQGSPDLHFLL